MSVKVMSWVWEHSRSNPVDRLVLLAIADCASEDGANAYPSMTELRRKTAMSERGVRYAIKRLVELGELFVATNAGPRGCNRYRVVMGDPNRGVHDVQGGAHGAPAHDAGGCTTCGGMACRGVHDVPETPAHGAPGTVLEPSVQNPSGSVATRRRGTRLPDPFEVTDDMRAWVRTHCPDVRMPEHDRFRDHWRAQPGQRGVKLDWQATWRNWMRRAQDDIVHRRQRADAPRGAAQPTSPAAACPRHAGQPAHNCSICRSEQLGGPP